MNNFWRLVNVSETEGELILYGPIASAKPWWADDGEGIYANQFTKDLKALGNITHLTMRINSGGGDVFAANAIYAQLKAHAAKVTGIIEGVAASAATILLSAADIVKAWNNSIVMVHDPLAGLLGYYNKKDLEKVGNLLDTAKASIINGYISKTGRTAEELSALMDKEKWMTAAEAKAEGFVDEIMDDVSVEATITNDSRYMIVNSIAHDLSGYTTRPPLGAAPTFVPPAKPPVAAAPAPVRKAQEKESEEVEIKNLEDLKKAYPDLCNQIVLDTTKAAAEAERSRIKSIDDISATIADDLVVKAKYETPITAEALAFESLKADAGNGRKFIDERDNELKDNKDVSGGASPESAEKAKEAVAIDGIAAGMNKKRTNGAEAK